MEGNKPNQNTYDTHHAANSHTIRGMKSNDIIHYIETAAQANPTGESYWKDIKVLNLPNLQARDC